MIEGNTSIQGWNSFMSWSSNTNLIDIAFTGPSFTWSNKRDPPFTIMETLGIGYASQSWFDHFPNSVIVNQPLICSDHGAIVFDNYGSMIRTD